MNGGSDPESAAVLVKLVPARVEALSETPLGADVDQLALVCWGLALDDIKHTDVLVQQMPRIRQLILEFGNADFGLGLDEVLLHSMIGAGRWHNARKIADGAIDAWPNQVLPFLSLRARVTLKQKQWDLCRADLDRADAILAESGSEAWPAAVDAAGVRLQLELSLGRIDFAANALSSVRLALDSGIETLGSDPETARSLTLASASYEADFNLAAERNDLVVRKLDALIASSTAGNEVPAQIHVQLALAHDGLELADPNRPPRAGEMFKRLSQDESLPGDMRIYTLLRLAIWHLSAARPAEAATVVSEIERLLDANEHEDESSPLWREAGMLRMVRSRIARALGSGAEEMHGHLAAISGAYEHLLEIWAGTPLLPGGLGFLQWGDRQELLSELLTLRAAYDPRGAEAGLGDVLAGEAQGSLARRLQLPIPTLEEIRAALVDDGGILAYIPSMRGGHLLTIDRQRVELFDLAAKHTLDRLARNAQIADFAASADSTRLLAGHLFPGEIVERLREWSHVYVVGLSELPEFPFEALPLGSEPGAPMLGRALPIARLPSIPVGVWLARGSFETQIAQPQDLALWIAPEPSSAVLARWPDLERIPFGEKEREQLQSPFGSGADSPFLLDANRETLSSDSLHGARILNLWCHGAWDDLGERPASLVLAPTNELDDGLVGCHAVENPKRTYPPMVVIAACGAALGPRRPGDDGLEHLGGAFFMGGARTVLMAAENLSYRDALEFTESFYAHLALGLTAAEAMRRARANSDTSVPLRLVGIAHQPLFSPPAQATQGWRSAGFLALVVVVALCGWAGIIGWGRRGRPHRTLRPE